MFLGIASSVASIVCAICFLSALRNPKEFCQRRLQHRAAGTMGTIKGCYDVLKFDGCLLSLLATVFALAIILRPLKSMIEIPLLLRYV